MEQLIHLDQQLFLWLNGLHTSWLDGFMYALTYKYTWVPFYLMLIYFFFKEYGWKGFYVLVAVILTITLSDQITSGFMKPFFARWRPCHDPKIGSLVHVVHGCGGSYGFASSHAANTFALATIVWLLFKDKWKPTRWIFLWAGIVSYTRIYVGVHYPGDVLVGALVGMLCAYVVYQVLAWISRQYLSNFIKS